MQYIQGNNRNQSYFSTLEEQVSAENAVRLIDAFIDKLDLQQLGFTGTVQKVNVIASALSAIFYVIFPRYC